MFTIVFIISLNTGSQSLFPGVLIHQEQIAIKSPQQCIKYAEAVMAQPLPTKMVITYLCGKNLT